MSNNLRLSLKELKEGLLIPGREDTKLSIQGVPFTKYTLSYLVSYLEIQCHYTDADTISFKKR